MTHILEAVRQSHDYEICWQEITDDFFNAIGELPIKRHKDYHSFHAGDGGFDYLIREYVVKARWNVVLDLLEIVYYWIHMRARELSGPFQQAINRLFSEEIVRWRMVNGKFERIIEQVAVIRQAENALRDQGFGKAHDHHAKAWASFHQRPEPDLDGCMDDAWDAVEIVAKHRAGLDGGTFDEALQKLMENGIVLEDWKQTFRKFYGLACNWVRHPKSEPLPCRIEDAEMFLVIASQMIIYMIAGYKQVKGLA